MSFVGSSSSELIFASLSSISVYQENNYVDLAAKGNEKISSSLNMNAKIESITSNTATYKEETRNIQQNVAYSYKFKSPQYSDFQLNSYGQSIHAQGDALQFSIQCGDYVVLQEDLNITVQLTLNYQFTSSEQKLSFQNTIGGYFPGLFSDSKVKHGVSISQTEYSGSISVTATQLGGDPQAFLQYLEKNKIQPSVECDFKTITQCGNLISLITNYITSEPFRRQISGSSFLPLESNSLSAIVSNTKLSLSSFFRELNTTNFNILSLNLQQKLYTLQGKLNSDIEKLEMFNNLYQRLLSKLEDNGKCPISYHPELFRNIKKATTKIINEMQDLLDPIFGIQSCFSINYDNCDILYTASSAKSYYKDEELQLYGEMCRPLSGYCTESEISNQYTGLAIDKKKYIVDSSFAIFRSLVANPKNGKCAYGCRLAEICGGFYLGSYISYITLILILMMALIV